MTPALEPAADGWPPHDVVVLWARPGPARGPRRRSSPSASASRSSRPATCCGPPSRDGTPLGREADRYMSRGQLVPDDIDRPDLPRPARASPTPPTGAILDGFPRTAAQAEALDAALAEARRPRSTAPSTSTSDARTSSGAWPAAGSARDSGHVYNLASQPAAGRRRLRPRRLRARPARRRPAGDRPGADGAAAPAAARGRRPLPRRAASCARSTAPADRRGHRRPARAPIASRRAVSRAPRPTGHPQVARRDRADAPGRPHRRRGPRPHRGASSSPASRPPTSTRSPRRTSARPAATPSFKGYPGINPRRPFPASVCISIDDEIVHGIPGERIIRDGQIVSIDAGAIVDGWHGDGARTFYRRRVAGAGRAS